MKLTILYPGYFPSLAWWQKLLAADVVVLLDDHPLPTGAHLNRTTIKTIEGKKAMTVPVLHPQQRPMLSEIKIDPTSHWQRTHLNTLNSNYRHAPYFDHYLPELANFFANSFLYLIELNLAGLRLISQFLHLLPQIHLSSEADGADSREQRVIHLLRHFGCQTYVIEENCSAYFNCQVLVNSGYAIETLRPGAYHYQQQFGDFIPGLSILDALLNEGPAVKQLVLNK